MEKSKFIKIVVYFILLIVGFKLALSGNYKLALISTTISIYGLIRVIYKIEQKNKLIEKGDANKYALFLIMYLIIDYLLYPKKFSLLELIFAIPFILIIWLYFSFVEKILKKYRNCNRNLV